VSIRVYLIRHGETDWSRSGRHTGRTDLALTTEGEERARAIGKLFPVKPLTVWTSPLQRARRTCELAGLAEGALVDDGLMEWDYGVYEGRTTLDIRREDPSWSVWLSPITGGESLDQVAARARSVIDRATSVAVGDIAFVAHGHILRILAACWVGLPPVAGRLLALDTATVSVLGYERQTRVIRAWNQIP